MDPVTAAVAAKAVTTISGALSRAFGETATDRGNRRVAALAQQALAGSDAAFVALCYEAFEPARGMPGDARPMKDGTRSPSATRANAARILKELAAARGGVPQAASQWAGAIGAPVAAPSGNFVTQAIDTVRGVVSQGVAQGTQQAIESRTQAVAAKAVPWVAIGGVAVVGAIALAFTAGRRR
jgi:hypothetical protein